MMPFTRVHFIAVVCLLGLGTAASAQQQPSPKTLTVPAAYLGKTIEGIEFTGLRRMPQDTVKALLASKLGEALSDEKLRMDFMALWNTYRFDDLQVRAEAGPAGGVIVRFIVRERPTN
jgi:outer membrane protein insertion porin family